MLLFNLKQKTNFYNKPDTELTNSTTLDKTKPI
jgi:hypothetical protein